jgi:outer membrane protein OmpA-like peptidoglycan-associated protein
MFVGLCFIAQKAQGQCKKVSVQLDGGTATGILCTQKVKASYGGFMVQEYRKGSWTFTNDDGKKFKSGEYRVEDGGSFRDGNWTWYNEDGKPVAVITFRRDQWIKVKPLDSGYNRMGNDSVVVEGEEDGSFNITISDGRTHRKFSKVQPGFELDLQKEKPYDPQASRPISGVIGINSQSVSTENKPAQRENVIWSDGKIQSLFPELKVWVGLNGELIPEEQNLILNPSFNTVKKDGGVGKLYFYNGMVKGWGVGNESPDYFREFGQQFMGFRAAGSNYEVIQGTLKKPLQQGKTYCFRFQVKLKSDNNYAINHIGAVFHDKLFQIVPTREVLSPVPTKIRTVYQTPVALRDSWMTIMGSFRSTGFEKYVYIGQFSSKDSTRFWPLDSIFNGATNGEVYYYFRNPVLTEKPAGVNCACNVEDCVPDSLFTEGMETRDLFVLRDVQFGSGSARLLPESYSALDSLAEQLQANPAWRLEIIGHTDNQGEPKDNLSLSVKRSRAVYDYLAGKDVATGRMKFAGKGDTEPLEDNETEEGRALNRRVEFLIIR